MSAAGDGGKIFGGFAAQGGNAGKVGSLDADEVVQPGADFTGVSSLSSESAEYLASIASGFHPDTFRETAQTLKKLSASEME